MAIEEVDKCGRLDWANALFVSNPELFLPVLESLKVQAPDEVEGLHKIFSELGVTTHGKILDVSCGIGRHSIHLAKKGYHVVGYDPSQLYINEANRWADKELADNSTLRFYHGMVNDITKILSDNGDRNFNAVIIMSNSLGYNGEEEDLLLLKNIISLCSEECVLITETENRDWRIRNFEPYVNYDFDNLGIYEKWWFNLETSKAESRSKFYKKFTDNAMGLMLDLDTSLRLYSLHELIKLLRCAGWKYLKSYGNIRTLEEASYNTQDIVTVSRKA